MLDQEQIDGMFDEEDLYVVDVEVASAKAVFDKNGTNDELQLKLTDNVGDSVTVSFTDFDLLAEVVDQMNDAAKEILEMQGLREAVITAQDNVDVILNKEDQYLEEYNEFMASLEEWVNSNTDKQAYSTIQTGMYDIETTNTAGQPLWTMQYKF